MATAFTHLLWVGGGHFIGSLLPRNLIFGAAGLLFIGFGIWTLVGGEEDEHDEGGGGRAAKWGPFVMILVTFMVAEMGDKTMLAAGAIAGRQQDFLPVWLGTTSGMVAADAIAVGIGITVGKKLPHRLIRIGAAAIFIAFGLFSLAQSIFNSA